MLPDIPSHPLNVDELFALHLWMVKHDPDHRYLTGIRVEHDPTEEERSRNWFNTEAAQRFEETLGKMGVLQLRAA